jgi:hypothetical protein
MRITYVSLLMIREDVLLPLLSFSTPLHISDEDYFQHQFTLNQQTKSRPTMAQGIYPFPSQLPALDADM